MSSPPVISFRVLMTSVVSALLVGVVASLAIRPPGQSAIRVDNADGQTLEEVRWRTPIAFNSKLPVLGEQIVHLVEHLEQASAGAVVLQPFEPGELVPTFGITEAVKDAKVPAGFTYIGYDQGRIPASTLLSAVPFGMEPYEFIAWWYHGGGRELGEAVYHEHQVHLLLCGVLGPETAGWFRFPIRSLDDLKGLKIRFAGLGGKVLQELGASVTMMPGSEIFQALEKGAIDATEFSQPVVDQMLGFDRVAKFNYFPGWHQPGSGAHLLVNLDLWNGLNEATRSLISLACRANVSYTMSRSESLQGEVLREFPDKGVTAETLPLEILEALQEVTEQVLDEEAEKDPWFARVLQSQREFSETYDLWKRKAFLPPEL